MLPKDLKMIMDYLDGAEARHTLSVERVTLYVVDNTRILGNAIVVKHSL